MTHMDLQLTQENRMVRDVARSFVSREVMPVVSDMDLAGRYPEELVKRLGDMGFMGAFVPEKYGGSGMDLLSYVIALEEFSKAWASLGAVMTVNNSLVCDLLLRFGTEAQKETYLTSLAQGKRVGCYALTEPNAGSDAGAIQTRATKSRGFYLLNGRKVFTTTGKHADVAIVYAVTDRSSERTGISAFLVEKGDPGFTVGRLENKLGLRASDTAELILENCRVPKENLVGKENEGLRIALSTLDGGRIGIAAQAVGIAQGCLELAIPYAKERHQFGQAIADFEAIRWMLADMATEIDAARLLTYRAAWLRDQGKPATKEASMAKLFASEAANRIAYQAVQIFGGYGYIQEFGVERLFRDARVTTLYEGTSEIQRLVIARQLAAEKAGADES